MTDKTISFKSNLKDYEIPINDILYVLMKKQDAYVHLLDGRLLKTRKTFAEFQDEMAMTLSEYTEAVLLRKGDTQSKQPYHALQRRLARILRTVQVGNHKEIP